MSGTLIVGVFAQSAANEFPKGTAIGIIVFFGAVALVSLAGLFASKDTLASMAEVIGTKNPTAARVVCGLGLLVGVVAVFVGSLALLGKL
jgi:hypothetical protein